MEIGIGIGYGFGGGVGETAPPLAPVTMTDTIEHRGVTFTLDRPMPVCRSCLGDPAVISTQAFAVTAISPASYQETIDATLYWVSGAMLNPGNLAVTGQGIDESFSTTGGNSSFNGTPIGYVPVLNLDPAATGSAVNFALGASGTLAKAVRKSGFNTFLSDPAPWSVTDKYVFLTILPDVPLAGFFRPGPAGSTKTIFGRAADVRYNVLQSLPDLPGALTQAEAEASARETYPFFGIANQQGLRRFDIEGGSNYSRDYALVRQRILAFLHSDASNAAKEVTLLRCIQAGIDLTAAYQDSGFVNIAGAGQGYGTSGFIYLAAFALHNADIMAAAAAHQGGDLGQHRYLTADDVGYDTSGQISGGNAWHIPVPAATEEIGKPEWIRDPIGGIFNTTEIELARYREMAVSGANSAAAVGALRNGPGGLTGLQAITDHGKRAALEYYDRFRGIRPGNATFPYGFGRTVATDGLYDALRAQIDLPLWQGVPEWTGYSGRVTVGAGAGEVDFDLRPDLPRSTQALTRVDARVSLGGGALGGGQYYEILDVGDHGTLEGLTPGLTHEIGFRFVSAAGPSKWSPNYPMKANTDNPADPDNVRRNVIVPPGTPSAAAPVNTVTPQVMVKTYPAFDYSDLEPAPATLDVGDFTAGVSNVTLYAGLGYWTGWPAPTFTYQWRRGGVNITGATSSSYTPDFNDSEAAITCRITADDGTTQVTADTPACTMPVIAAPGAWSDDFSTDTTAQYSTFEGNNPTTGGGTFVHNPAGDGSAVFTQDGILWEGITTPVIPVVAGAEVAVSITFRRITTAVLGEVTIGRPGAFNAYAAANFASTTPIVYDFTVTPTTTELTIHTRMRGSSNQSFEIFNISVTPT